LDIDFDVDEELLGGLYVTIDEHHIDLSTSTKVSNLLDKLSSEPLPPIELSMEEYHEMKKEVEARELEESDEIDESECPDSTEALDSAKESDESKPLEAVDSSKVTA